MPTYRRADLVISRGEGCYVYDTQGRKYLDFIGGIATCTVGHANPEVTQAIAGQAAKLISVSNMYYTEPQIRLAAKLSALSGLSKCFFGNSGTESNEAAIKLAKKVTGRTEFVAFTQSFHGRTGGSLALTWKEEFKRPFLPLMPKVHFAEYNNLDSLRALMSAEIAAVIVEPVQGEAGIVVPDAGFLDGVRQVCSENKSLMIVDEVQTGVGRTGSFFAFTQAGVKPDIVTLAKGLANGVPIGVCLSDYAFEAGDHGSTLGGNSLAATAANATIHYLENHHLQENAREMGAYFIDRLRQLQAREPAIKAVRGVGLMVGIELAQPVAKDVVKRAIGQGLLCNAATPAVVRFLPPLVVSKAEVDEAVSKLRAAVRDA